MAVWHLFEDENSKYLEAVYGRSEWPESATRRRRIIQRDFEGLNPELEAVADAWLRGEQPTPPEFAVRYGQVSRAASVEATRGRARHLRAKHAGRLALSEAQREAIAGAQGGFSVSPIRERAGDIPLRLRTPPPAMSMGEIAREEALELRRQRGFARAQAARGEGYMLQFLGGPGQDYETIQQAMYATGPSGRQATERLSYRERQIQRESRRLQRKFGYYYEDPRLNYATRFGRVQGQANIVFDIETLMTGPGARPYNIAFQQLHDIPGGGFTRSADVFVPLEMVYREDILAAISQRREGLKFDAGVLTQEGLRRRFVADYSKAASNLMTKEQMHQELGRILAEYNTMWERGLTRGAIFDVETGQAEEYFIRQLQRSGIYDSLTGSYDMATGRGLPNLIGKNIKYDIPILRDLLGKASGGLLSEQRRWEKLGKAGIAGDIGLLRTEMEALKKGVGGEVVWRMGASALDKAIPQTIRPGAGAFDVTALAETKDWKSFVRREIKTLADREAGLDDFGKIRLKMLRDIQRRTPTLTEMGQALRIDFTGIPHGAMADVTTTVRILEKMSREYVTGPGGRRPAFAEAADMTVGRMIELASQGVSRRNEEIRMRLAGRIGQFLEAGPATLRTGRLSGATISSMFYRGGGRYVAGLAGAAGVGVEMVSPLAEELFGKINKAYQLDARSSNYRAVRRALEQGKFSNEKDVTRLLNAYSQNRGKSVGQLIDKLWPELKYPQSTLTSILRNTGGVGDYADKGALDRALLQVDEVTKNVNAIFARKSTYLPRTLTDADAERMLARYAGGIKPMEDLRGAIREVVRARLGIGRSSTGAAVKLADLMSADLYMRALMGVMESAPGDIRGGMGLFTEGVEASSLAVQVRRQRKILSEQGYSIGQAVEDAIAENGKILSAKEMESIKALREEIAFTGEGYTRQFPIWSRTFRDAIQRVFPDLTYRLADTADATQSASSVISDLRIMTVHHMSRAMAQGAIDATTRERGLWHIAQYLRQASTGYPATPWAATTSGAMLTESVGDLMEILRNWGGSGGNLEKMIREAGLKFDTEGQDIARMIGYLSQVSAQDFSFNKVMDELSRQHALSLDRITAWGGAGADIGDTLAARIPDVRAFEAFDEAISKMDYDARLAAAVEKGFTETPYQYEVGEAYKMATSSDFESLFRQETATWLGRDTEAVASEMRRYLGTEAGKTHFWMLISANQDIIESSRAARHAEDYLNTTKFFDDKAKTKAARRLNAANKKYFRDLTELLYRPPEAPGAISWENFQGMQTGRWYTRRIPDAEAAGGFRKIREFRPFAPSTIVANIKAQESLINEAFGLGPITSDIDWLARDLNVAAMVMEGQRVRVPVNLFGTRGTGQTLARISRLPDVSLISHKGEILSDTLALINEQGAKAFVGRSVMTGQYETAAQMAFPEREFGYYKGLTHEEAFGVATPGVRTIGISDLSEELANQLILRANQAEKYENISYLDMIRMTEESTTSMAKAGEDMIRGMSRTRDTMRSVGRVVQEAPAGWKILAAGVAGAAAITMMRRNRPLMPEDNMAYGGFPGGNAYPMAPPQVGQASTYYAPPAAGGLQASISGVVGPGVDVANLQALVGSMGFANINVNDNSRSISQRDIDQMISSRL